MDTDELFAAALPLNSPSIVSESRFEGNPKRLILKVDLEDGSHCLDCPKCATAGCSIHDRRERKWRHLNFWQYETELIARVPRVKYEECASLGIAVGTAVAGGPPHRSVREELLHTAPASCRA